MGLVDLFRPKWKHSDAAVRASAVRLLSTDDEDILVSIAKNDDDAAVRRIAIKKLSNPSILVEIARQDPDEGLRNIADEKATTLLIDSAIAEDDQQESAAALAQIINQDALAHVAKTAALEPIRRAALSRLTDPKAISDVARNATEPAVRLSAIEQLHDQATLRTIAMGEAHKEVALAALQNIHERETLEAIAKKAKLKNIRARAQKMLQTSATEEPRSGGEGIQHNQLVQICRTVEALARSADLERAAQKIEEARTTWRAIAADADEELRLRFDEICVSFFSRFTHWKAQKATQAQQSKELREGLAVRLALCERVEALEGSDIASQLKNVQEEWHALDSRIPEAQRAVIEKRFWSACEACQQRIEDWQAGKSIHAQAEKLCQEAEALLMHGRLDEARRAYQQLAETWRVATGGNAAAELQARFAAVKDQLLQRDEEIKAQKEQRKRNNQARLEALCTELESLVTTNDLRGTERKIKDAVNKLRKLTPLPSREIEEQLKQRFQAAKEQATARIRELREADDWQRWANLPKLEELCQRAESLAKEESLKTLAHELRRIQGEWKKVGPAPKDKSQPLWERFKTACDQAHERCQDFFKQQDAARKENLKQKEELCLKVEALVESTDWGQTAAEIKQLQAEWKKIGPAPKKQSDAIWKRFRKACDRFFERRQEFLEQSSSERIENLKQKEQLCVTVEGMAESTDWINTTRAIKQLQVEWKKIGPAPRSQSDAVWKRFRAACDHFFERRQQQQDQERSENQIVKEQLIKQLEITATRLLGEQATEADPLAREGEAALQSDDPADEAALTSPTSDPAFDSAQVVRQVQEARAEWKSIGPVPQQHSDAIWDRFNAVCQQIVEICPDCFRNTDLDPEANLKQKEKLCQQVEAFLERAPQPDGQVHVESVEDMAEQLRQALQANALSDKTTKEEPDWRAIAEEVQQIQQSWRRIGPVPRSVSKTLWERFHGACNRVFELQRQAQHDEEDQLGDNLQRKQELCDRAETLAQSTDPGQHLEEMRVLKQQWQAIGPVPRGRGKALWHRFRKAGDRVSRAARARKEAEHAAASEEGAPQNDTASRTVRSEIKDPAEEAVLVEGGSPQDTPPEDSPAQASPADIPADAPGADERDA